MVCSNSIRLQRWNPPHSTNRRPVSTYLPRSTARICRLAQVIKSLKDQMQTLFRQSLRKKTSAGLNVTGVSTNSTPLSAPCLQTLPIIITLLISEAAEPIINIKVLTVTKTRIRNNSSLTCPNSVNRSSSRCKKLTDLNSRWPDLCSKTLNSLTISTIEGSWAHSNTSMLIIKLIKESLPVKTKMWLVALMALSICKQVPNEMLPIGLRRKFKTN